MEEVLSALEFDSLPCRVDVILTGLEDPLLVGQSLPQGFGALICMAFHGPSIAVHGPNSYIHP